MDAGITPCSDKLIFLVNRELGTFQPQLRHQQIRKFQTTVLRNGGHRQTA